MLVQVQVGRFKVSFSGSELYYMTFECVDYNGVILADFTHRYEVLNGVLGERLLITRKHEFGFCQDLPFHLGTAHFLPKGVTVDLR